MQLDHPFRGSQAVRDGLLTRHALAADFQRVYRDVYVPKAVEIDAVVKARAAQVFAGDDAIICGLSASAVHGAKWIDAREPAELIWPRRKRQLDGILVRYDSLADADVTSLGDMTLTTVPRTMFDLARRLPRLRALQSVDALANASGVSVGEAQELVRTNPGVRGVTRAAEVLSLADGGAESPQETRVRLLLLDAGLPRPETRVRIRDEFGHVFACCDLGWSRWKVAVVYDGSPHRTRERIDRIDEVDWAVVRVDSDQLKLRPFAVVERVRATLRAAGAPV
ncbi:hypothetical protein [Rhodococcoides kyotonense]|uniref:DUF559 domain-containing protein n=1 Tax=Rhodococcoides kyotonense TaxID=398843 RepID=A0A177YJ30_9NOCA|nr:hypothetical protein [Rhodococcus kyotonensis]OAK55239.1 hypothetical protein A3K89_20480 [Rhodococcus kyotonensis]